MAQEMKERIFISYKRVDKDRVFAIKDGIEQATGEKCWIDLDGIESDAQFANVIIKAINQCEVFLFMYSKEHSVLSNFEDDWTIKEITFAKEKKKRIVIIHIDDTPLIDQFLFEFPRKQRVNATETSALVRLHKDLCSWLDVDMRYVEQMQLPEDGFQVGDLVYKASDCGCGVVVIKYVGEQKTGINLFIPNKIKYGHYDYEVTSIGTGAFFNLQGLISIEIPNSVTSIGDGAFALSGLTSVIIPSSVKSIGKEVFWRCESLTSVMIPSSVKSIGTSAFFRCLSLTSITIPNGVTSIGDTAFWSCSSLTSVVIPDSVTKIGTSAFWACSSLISVTISNSVTSIGDATFRDCSSLTSVVIPSSVTSIGDSVFKDCASLISVTIPNSVTSIGYWTFRGCSSLTSVDISNGVKEIGYEAFSCCEALISITIPNSVISLGDKVFYGCSSLKSIKIPKGLTNIGSNAFPDHTKVIRD